MSSTNPFSNPKKAFTSVGNALYKAFRRPSGSSTIPSVSDEEINASVKMVPRTEPPPFPTSAEVQDTAGTIATMEPTMAQSTRDVGPAPTQQTLLPVTTASATATSSTTTSAPAPNLITTEFDTGAPAASPEPSAIGPSTIGKRARKMIAAAEQAEKLECKICLYPLDPTKVRKTWSCFRCKGQLHMKCFEEWNHQNIRLFQSTPCPFCRWDRWHAPREED